MKAFWLIVALLLAVPAAAQDAARKKKPQAKKTQQLAHKKPTPEQIRKFKELEKKQNR